MVTSKCEAEIGLFLTATPKKKGKKEKKERRKGRAWGSMSESEEQVGRERKSGKADFFVSKW